MGNNWVPITPAVNMEAEFFEIANDFGNPLELLREAISNSVDAGATWARITFTVEEIDGAKTLVIEIEDDGMGMTRDVLSRDFWGLGYSTSRSDKNKIGEKGHGTKIYLRSEKVHVVTRGANGAFESICEKPLRSLTKREVHSPSIREAANDGKPRGTWIRIEGYNQNERSAFVQNVVRDYILWFTKVGSVEHMFGIDTQKNFRVLLKCLDAVDHEEIAFGHVFPQANDDIQKLFNQYDQDAADLFVKRYIWKGRLRELPEITYECVVSVEGDKIKREYNPMIRERKRTETGTYKVSDRYGIWLCKDFMPVQRVNEWITGFGVGSNSFVLLHGFLNCQSLKLTANRGSVANTDPKLVEELRKEVQALLEEVDKDLRKNGLFTLLEWQVEQRTIKQETAEFDSRAKAASRKRIGALEGMVLPEPRNEAELFGLFTMVYAKKPELFEFTPFDYSTARGIDMVARNRSGKAAVENRYWYVEFKYLLRDKFNHAFQNLRWIVCWDFDKRIRQDETQFRSIEDADVRNLEVAHDSDGQPLYFLNRKGAAMKIQVIRLKETLEKKLNVTFTDPDTASAAH